MGVKTKIIYFSLHNIGKNAQIKCSILKLTVLVPITCERLVPEIGSEETCNTGHQA
jgi:hypothetical protein